MQRLRHVVVIAGEASGDIHAAAFINDLKIKHPGLRVSGVGGSYMEEAGVELISDLARYGVTGLSAVFRHLRVIHQAFRAVQAHLKTHQPDLLILVDYPGFNLRLAKFAKRVLNLRIIYYISPQVWAWKAKRMAIIRECVDHMAVILPFEKQLYQHVGVPVSFVGHPLLHKIKPYQNMDTALARTQLQLPQDKRIIALVPGSRTHEIEYHMPVLAETAHALSRQSHDVHWVIPVAATINPALVESYMAHHGISYTLVKEQALLSAAASDCIVVASGTASLECALLAKPMCIIYKSSWLTYLVASQVIQVKYLGLCNLLYGSMLVPEFLQDDCNAQALIECLSQRLLDPRKNQQMIQKLQFLQTSLSSHQADCTISELIDRELASLSDKQLAN